MADKEFVVSARVSKAVADALDNLAGEQDRTTSYIVGKILVDYLEGNNLMDEKRYSLDEMIELTGATGLGMFLDAFVGKTINEINATMIEMFGLEGDDMDFSRQIAIKADEYNAYGTVDHNGDTVYLKQQAYSDNHKGELCYKAHGIDAENKEYIVYWWPVEGYYDHKIDESGECAVCGYGCKFEDESLVCDWDAPFKFEEL